MRKARLKKEQKEAPQATNADTSENPDESVAAPAPAPTQHHHGGHDDGIIVSMAIKLLPHHQTTHIENAFASNSCPQNSLTKCISQHTKF